MSSGRSRGVDTVNADHGTLSTSGLTGMDYGDDGTGKDVQTGYTVGYPLTPISARPALPETMASKQSETFGVAQSRTDDGDEDDRVSREVGVEYREGQTGTGVHARCLGVSADEEPKVGILDMV